MIENRYLKNMNMLSATDMELLKHSKVCVIGCGGLGGYVIEMLGRLGIGSITAVDGDVFDETNLNRQLRSDTRVLGKSKAETEKERMLLVNPLIKLVTVPERITPVNGHDLLAGHNVIIDAVDNIETRLLLQKLASELGIILVHGAIAGWYGQVTTIFPGDNTLNVLYSGTGAKGIEKELGNPSFTPALVASIEVSEVLKYLIGRGTLLRKKVLYIDLLEQAYTTIQL